MKYVILSTVLVASFVTSSFAEAKTVIRTSNQFELTQDQAVEGNFLGVGMPISLSGTVSEDAVVFGDRVTVTGDVGGDVLAGGVLTRIEGVVSDDVRVLSGNTVLSGEVAGDVLVISGSVDVLSNATVDGDLVVYGGTVHVGGTVGGDVLGAMQELVVDGAVGGAIDVTVHQLTLGSTASITGAVKYTSNNLLDRGTGTVIGGSVVRSDAAFVADSSSVWNAVFSFLLLVFTTLMWLVLSRKTLRVVTVQTMTNTPRSAIVGALTFFVTPLVLAVLFMSMIGSYLALIGLMLYVLLLLLAVAAIPAIVGHICFKLTIAGEHEPVSTSSVLLGAAVVGALLLIPTIGVVVCALLVVLILGGLVEALVRAVR